MAKKKRRGGGGNSNAGAPIIGVLLLCLIIGGISNGTLKIPGIDGEPIAVPSFPELPKVQVPPPPKVDVPPVAQPPGEQPPADPPVLDQPPTADPPPAVTTTAQEALTLLDSIEVKGKAPKTGYARDQFGPTWKDTDGNGCDTRNDILKRDLTNITFKGSDGCTVETGTLNDPYTGKTINFVRGQKTSTAVQIDHRVALANAWVTGAQKWSGERRTQFANDPINLVAVDGPTNGSKGDKDAATWLPPNKSYRCEYVATQVRVKAAYGLWVTQAERDAMRNVLTKC